MTGALELELNRGRPHHDRLGTLSTSPMASCSQFGRRTLASKTVPKPSRGRPLFLLATRYTHSTTAQRATHNQHANAKHSAHGHTRAPASRCTTGARGTAQGSRRGAEHQISSYPATHLSRPRRTSCTARHPCRPGTARTCSWTSCTCRMLCRCQSRARARVYVSKGPNTHALTTTRSNDPGRTFRDSRGLPLACSRYAKGARSGKVLVGSVVTVERA